MAELLRSLHPARELMQYDVISLWAIYPDANPHRPHVEPPRLEDNSWLNEGRPIRQSRSERVILAWLSDEPRSIPQCAEAVGVAFQTARDVLAVLAKRGLAQRITNRTDARGRHTVLYARVK